MNHSNPEIVFTQTEIKNFLEKMKVIVPFLSRFGSPTQKHVINDILQNKPLDPRIPPFSRREIEFYNAKVHSKLNDVDSREYRTLIHYLNLFNCMVSDTRNRLDAIALNEDLYTGKIYDGYLRSTQVKD